MSSILCSARRSAGGRVEMGEERDEEEADESELERMG